MDKVKEELRHYNDHKASEGSDDLTLNDVLEMIEVPGMEDRGRLRTIVIASYHDAFQNLGAIPDEATAAAYAVGQLNKALTGTCVLDILNSK